MPKCRNLMQNMQKSTQNSKNLSESAKKISLRFKVTGPPEFLKNTAGLESGNSSHSNPRKIPYGTKLPSTSHVRKELPVGAIVEAKPQAGDFTNEGTPVVKKESSQKPPEATAKLLGVCPECSVPKTYSAAREGLICPICKDRRIDSGDPNKRRGSKIKDKERSKRMKGQSSHATWKSETEMQLRQHFD
ncbi:hypothetical protein KP509_19G043900 [Ceratopteris richardii]|uniref:Uncharacterized protein n=1 Tax=Ceratopteris richardii TaxID=49495 RepID=A0A8T2QZ91_CERRI|nr:hypothetical protein KP509_31G041300 [Ceratopteris richardii]KAH7352419.1 hypothetical protein KP509_19G043900 [Ceratopteris richardii]